jgi:hypothetical protein
MNAALAFLNAAGRDRQTSGRHVIHGLLMMDVLLGTRRFYRATAYLPHSRPREGRAPGRTNGRPKV